MSYIDETGLDKRFGVEEMDQLLDPTASGTRDATILPVILTDTDGLIDGYLSGLYSVPLTVPIPSLVEGIAADLVRYRLYDDQATEAVRDRYKDAIKMLEQIQKGIIVLETVDSNAGNGIAFEKNNDDRIFTLDNLSDF